MHVLVPPVIFKETGRRNIKTEVVNHHGSTHWLFRKKVDKMIDLSWLREKRQHKHLSKMPK